MDKVRAEVPCEDSTLQAMSICYREIHQPDKISEVYEAAAKIDPTNEELLTHLFMSYVRLGDFKKQQQTALALYKLKLKNPYYFWAVMSIVMQALKADEKLAKGIILPLAERMVLKLVNEGKMEAEQELQLYLMILELQGKDEEILNVLSGPLASRLSAVPQRKASLLLQLQRYPEASAAFKELINQDIDNWAYYQDYLKASLKHQTPKECLDFLNETAASTQGTKARAPHLARFELLVQIQDSEEAQKLLDPVQLMRQYFAMFGEKSCVVGDLKLYLNLLTSPSKLNLLQQINEDVGVKSDEYPKTIEQMQRHIHMKQLQRICGLHHCPIADRKEREKLAERLLDLYDEGSTLSPFEDRLPTDFCPADPYALLASHLLHQLYFESNDASYLYRAMELLERCLLSSPANFHLKILLVRIYLEVGLIGGADHAFTLLDAKHIQLDSLGYLHTPLLAPLGHLSRASATLDHAAKFFVANYKDSADHLTFAYKYGSFVKIQEFVELRERLENSFHFAMTTVDKMLLELSWCDSPGMLFNTLSTMRIQPHEDSIRWDLLRDNRDLEVIVGWEPLSEKNEDLRMKEETRECMLRLLAARSLILRIIAACAEFDASAPTSQSDSTSPPLLARLSAQLKQLATEEIPATLRKFEDPEKSGVINYKASSVLVPMDALARLREAYESEQLITVVQLADSLTQCSYPDVKCLEALRSSASLQTLHLPEFDSPVSYKPFLLRATTCGETLAFLAAMCSACATQMQPRMSNKKNRKKLAGKENSSLPSLSSISDHLQSWTDVGTFLAEKAKNLETALSGLENLRLQTGIKSDADTKKVTATAIVSDRGEASIVQSCLVLTSREQLTLKLINSLRS
ncbi:N-alpha-acetyltransferase 25, NatB auxiliary subunit isoform X2 [Cephus cinctus]|nr:N-alpha-acetyltransferase 25, NatB auxiliary subunit isoform X2 [Cephus cinctus]